MVEERSIARAERLRDGLRRELDIYHVLHGINIKQRRVMESGRTEEILQFAERKRVELTRIEEIEKDLTPLKEEWRDLREDVPRDLRSQVEEEMLGIETVLRDLIEQENEGQKEIEEIRVETSKSLQRVDGGRRVHQAYGAPNAARPQYLDHTR